MKKYVLLISLALTVAACSVNPVTGESEFSLLSMDAEVAVGEKNYLPTRQAQGGDYRVHPHIQRYINDVGRRLVKVADNAELPYEFVVINNSVPNAWALPGGKIALNRGLLMHLKDEAQLAAVLAHEIVHAAARHGASQQTRGALLQLGANALQAGAAGQPFQRVAELATSLGGSAWLAKYSRKDELEADLHGMRYMHRAGYEPVAAVELQQTFLALNGSDKSQKTHWFGELFASHPPSSKRVAANQATARKLGSGSRYTERYERMIAPLKVDALAYRAARDADRALAKNAPDKALALLDQAVSIQPEESIFWRLRGDAWRQLKNLHNAELAYTTAITKNSIFYLNFLARGELRYDQGQTDAALADIQQSYDLLPTERASYYLGIVARDQGQLRRAKMHLQAASAQPSALGKRAQRALINLYLESAPQQLFNVSVLRTEQGSVRVQLQNTAPVALLVERLQIEDPRPGIRWACRIDMAIALPSGASTTFDIGDPVAETMPPAPLLAAKVVVASLVE